MLSVRTQLSELTSKEQDRFERFLLAFDQDWRPSLLAERLENLPKSGEARKAGLLEMVKIDLEKHWAAGFPKKVEDYLRDLPELGTAETVPAELLLAEYLVRKQQGEKLSSREYAERFPRRVEALKQAVEKARQVMSNPGLEQAQRSTSNPGQSTKDGVASKAIATKLPNPFAGRYRLEKELGQGGMGSVYLAYDLQLERQVALKVPHFRPKDGNEIIQRFYREAKSAATLDHPNICAIYDVGQVDGIHYLTMAYIEGKPLSSYINPNYPLPPKQIATLVRTLALALQEAHEKGILHRDLKPANIMVNQRKQPVVMDFGLARRESDVRLTDSGGILGTPAYMSPEQVGGNPEEVKATSDIYSLGVILYELLTGQIPFQGRVANVLAQIISSPNPKPSLQRKDLDPQLEAICLKAMAKRPEDRFSSMSALAAALTNYLQDKSGERETVPVARLATQVTGRSMVPNLTAKENPPFSDLTPPATSVIPGKPATKKKPQKLRSPNWLLIAVGIAIPVIAIVVFGIISLTIRTSEGTVNISLENTSLDKVKIEVDGNQIKIKESGKAYTFQVGDHKLLVEAPGFKTYTNNFIIKQGDNGVIRVNLEPVSPASNEPGKKTPTENESKWVKVFKGGNISAWLRDGGSEKNWRVEGDEIVAIGAGAKQISWLLSDKDYQDFHLKLEYQVSNGANSGVCFRAVPGEKNLSNLIPFHAEVQIADDLPARKDPTGAIWISKRAGAGGILQPEFPAVQKRAGQWNQMEIKLVGQLMEVWVNGNLVTKVGWAKYVDQPNAAPGLNRTKGRIGLQAHTGEVRFRNVEIKELNGSFDSSQLAYPFFNGKSLLGWEGLPNYWRVEDGQIIGEPPAGKAKHTFLCSEIQYKDFELKFNVWMEEGLGNSGIQIRSWMQDRNIYKVVGPQVDIGEQFWGGLYGEGLPGVGWIQSPLPEVQLKIKPKGWNEYRIKCVGKHVTVVVNGVTAVDLEVPSLREEGIIAWQIHGGRTPRQVIFKDIEFQEINNKTGNTELPGPRDNSPPPGFKLLFNGKNLDGWQGLVPINEREKMTPEQYRDAVQKANARILPHWSAREGMLYYDGNGDSLQTKMDYRNFEMYIDWKIGPKGDSGIYLRGAPQVQIWDNPIGSGGLFNNKNYSSKPLVAADNPVGEWNTFHILMKGDRVTIFLNGRKVVDNTPLENYWNRRQPIPEVGPIELQHQGNPLWFKNIYIKELPD